MLAYVVATSMFSAAGARGLDRTVTIAPGIDMPTMNLGTNPRNDPVVDIGPWFAAGGSGIDTADVYGSQTVIAPLIKDFARDSFFITSKIPVGNPWPETCSDSNASIVIEYARKINAELGLDYVDLMLLHFPCDNEEANRIFWNAMVELRTKNLARSIGVSNYNASQLEALSSGVMPAVNQCEMSVSVHDDATLKYCQNKGVQYEAYKVIRGCPFDDGRVKTVAASHNVSTAQVCLRYVLEKGVVIAAGTGKNTSTVEEYTRADLGVYDFAFTDDEFNILDSIATSILV